MLTVTFFLVKNIITKLRKTTQKNIRPSVQDLKARPANLAFRQKLRCLNLTNQT
jgi:hypothetical protein